MGPPDRPQKSVKFWIPKADDTTADADTRQVRSCNLQLQFATVPVLRLAPKA